MNNTLYQKIMYNVAKLIFPKTEIICSTPQNNEPAVYLCNHSGAIGPALMTLYFKKPHSTWLICYALDKKRMDNFIYHDFFFSRSKKCRKFWRFFSKLIGFFLRPLLDLSKPIPVYHDQRMLSTFKSSLDSLTAGESLVIFPEKPKPFSEYVNNVYAGFADLGRSYYKSTGKNLKFYPVYAEKKNRKILIGDPIEYVNGKSYHLQRQEIADFIRDGIDKLARSLPKHKPTPFLPSAWYEYYGEYTDNPMEYWKLFENEFE